MGNKYYAVRKGKQTGIYTTWDDCKQYVTGYPGAEYKGFINRKDAEDYLNVEESKIENNTEVNYRNEDKAIAYVDGSFNSETKEFSFGAIVFWDGKEYKFSEKFDDPKLAEMHNVAGELQGSIKVMEFAIENNIKVLDIFHDYEGIEKWCTGEWQAKKEGTKSYKSYYEKIKDKVQINFIKVKGHSGDKYNDLVDKLAKEAMLKPIAIKLDAQNIEPIVAKEVQNKTHSLVVSKEWIDKLIKFMNSLENVTFNQVSHSIPKYECYQYRSSGGDKITFNVYETGKFVIQGKPAYLYGEAISFLAYCPEITIEDILEANNKLQNMDIKVSDIRNEITAVMPNSYGKIEDTIFKMLSPSLSLKKVNLELEDYSCYAFPALRALEGYLKYLLNLKNINVSYDFGKIFVYNQQNSQYYLKRKIATAMADIKMKLSLERIYNYFHKNRHTIFHTDQILIQSRILEDKQEADLIINEVIDIIESTYNDITC